MLIYGYQRNSQHGYRRNSNFKKLYNRKIGKLGKNQNELYAIFQKRFEKFYLKLNALMNFLSVKPQIFLLLGIVHVKIATHISYVIVIRDINVFYGYPSI